MAAKRSAAARAKPPVTPPRTVRPVAAPPPRTVRAVAGPRPATDLDRLLHDRTRLAIVSALAVNEALSFAEVKALTDTTDGNLSVHARKLEEAGYVSCTKSFDGRVPRTEFALTAAGRRALQKYLDHMEAIIHHARAKDR
jgi:DNA-binding transcriptional ArsR family regulator